VSGPRGSTLWPPSGGGHGGSDSPVDALTCQEETPGHDRLSHCARPPRHCLFHHRDAPQQVCLSQRSRGETENVGDFASPPPRPPEGSAPAAPAAFIRIVPGWGVKSTDEKGVRLFSPPNAEEDARWSSVHPRLSHAAERTVKPTRCRASPPPDERRRRP
jgi:hypothetical protein